MAEIYFAKIEADGRFGPSSIDQNFSQDKISVVEINRAFPNRAKSADLLPQQESKDPTEVIRDMGFNAVVIRISDHEVDGQFSAEGHWLLHSVTVEKFIDTFPGHFPNSISGEKLDQDRKEAIAKMREERV